MIEDDEMSIVTTELDLASPLLDFLQIFIRDKCHSGSYFYSNNYIIFI